MLLHGIVVNFIYSEWVTAADCVSKKTCKEQHLGDQDQIQLLIVKYNIFYSKDVAQTRSQAMTASCSPPTDLVYWHSTKKLIRINLRLLFVLFKDWHQKVQWCGSCIMAVN